jgi:hypothetical protein
MPYSVAGNAVGEAAQGIALKREFVDRHGSTPVAVADMPPQLALGREGRCPTPIASRDIKVSKFNGLEK